MSEITMAAAAAPFGRELEACFNTVGQVIGNARGKKVDLLVLPEAALGGYVETLHGDADPPPAFAADGPELKRVADMAGDMTVCVGFCEDGGDGVRYNAAACVSAGEVLGIHRKVHLPLDEDRFTTPHDTLTAFDTPVGRIAMVICYDKAFPEAARTMALQGAEILCILSAWPSSATNSAENLTDDRQWRRSELWDRSRAAENSFFVVSANQTGEFGSMRFLGGARVVGPGGDPIAETGTEPGLAVASADVSAEVEHARKALSPIRDLRPEAYLEARPMTAA